MTRTCFMALVLECALLMTPACQSTRSSPAVDRHDPEAVLRAYFAAWARNDTDAQTSFMIPSRASWAHEPVDSLRVLSITPVDGASPTTRSYSVSFEVTFKGGRSVSMENGRYNWTYSLIRDATNDSWLIANYGAGEFSRLRPNKSVDASGGGGFATSLARRRVL